MHILELVSNYFMGKLASRRVHDDPEDADTSSKDINDDEDLHSGEHTHTLLVVSDRSNWVHFSFLNWIYEFILA